MKRERIEESSKGKKEKNESETEEKEKEKTGEKCARKESCNRKMYDQVCLAPAVNQRRKSNASLFALRSLDRHGQAAGGC